jgi:hypothetical protein
MRLANLAVAAFLGGLSFMSAAQQNIPRGSLDQGIPGFDPKGQGIPGVERPNGPRIRGAQPSLGADSCTLGEVVADDVASLRLIAVNLLNEIPGAAPKFLEAEKHVPANCLRARAEFYIRVIGRVHAAGNR